MPLPWRRLHAGAVWECGRCHQQWEWLAGGEARGWHRLPRQAWIDGEPVTSGGPPPAAWSSVLYGTDREKV